MKAFLWTVSLVAAVLRGLSLADPTLSLDEGYSVFFSRIPLRSIFMDAGLDSNPPLGNAFFHLWSTAVGYEPVLMRLPGVVASLFTLLLLWQLVRPVLPAPAAAFVLIFKAVSLYDVLYSRQLRVYPFAELLLVVSWLCLQRLIEVRSMRWAALWAVFSAAACHVHYFCALVVAATALVMIGALWRDKKLALASVGMCAVLAAPLALPLAQQLLVHKSFGWISEPMGGVLLVAAYQLCGYSLVVLVAAVVLLFAAIVIRDPGVRLTPFQRHRSIVTVCLVQIGCVVLLAALLSKLGASFFHPRYFFFLQVPFLCLLSLGLEPFGRRAGPIVAVIVAGAAGLPCMTHLVEAAQNPTGFQVIERAVPGLSEKTLLVHRTKCSFSVGQAYDRFRHQHRLLDGGGDSNVFHYPGLPPVFISAEEASATPEAVFVALTDGCPS